MVQKFVILKIETLYIKIHPRQKTSFSPLRGGFPVKQAFGFSWDRYEPSYTHACMKHVCMCKKLHASMYKKFYACMYYFVCMHVHKIYACMYMHAYLYNLHACACVHVHIIR